MKRNTSRPHYRPGVRSKVVYYIYEAGLLHLSRATHISYQRRADARDSGGPKYNVFLFLYNIV